MWKSCLASALGNLSRHPLYSAITVAGLTLGFAAALIIALYVRDELTYDCFIRDSGHVYMLTRTSTGLGGGLARNDAAFPNLAAALKLEFPQVAEVARVMTTDNQPELRRGDVRIVEPTFDWVDPDFFAVMPMKAVAGDPRTALKSPDGIVLTRSAARKYFGRDAPLGETLSVNPAMGVHGPKAFEIFNQPHPMRVAAVIEDWPSNTSFKGEVLGSGRAPFSNLSLAEQLQGRGNPWQFSSYIFVRLKPGASADEVRRGLTGFASRHIPTAPFQGVRFGLDLVPLPALHLRPPAPDAMTRRGDVKVIAAIAAVAVLIVVSASINFITLMTARAARRALETGVRKAAGATRRDLVVQFLGEALIHVGLGMIGAVALAELLLPPVGAFLKHPIAFDYLHDPALLAELVGATLILGVLAGFYPALVMSAYRPASALKGQLLQPARGGAARQALVTLQFGLMITLIIATATLYRQTAYVLNDRIRVDGSKVLLIEDACEGPDARAFQQQIAATPGVQASVCTSDDFGYGGESIAAVVAGRRPARLVNVPVAFGYFEFYGLKPLAGRFFVQGRGADGRLTNANPSGNPSVVINETAMRRLGFGSPAEAVGKIVTWTHRAYFSRRPGSDTTGPSEIIGVAPDFVEDARKPVEPQLMFVDPGLLDFLSVRLAGSRIPETLQAIDRGWEATGHRHLHRRFLDQTLQALYADVIVQSAAIGVGAGLALVIAALGLLGLAAHSAEQRTKEIGVRKVMGASTADLVRLLLWQFSRPVLIANLIAWPIALWAMNRWLSGFADHVDLPPWLFLAAGGAALLIAGATVLTHALRVAGAAPVTALRYE